MHEAFSKPDLYVGCMQELRVKGSYVHHKEIRAAQGVKLAGPGLESAVAGTQLLVVGPEDDVSLLKEEVMQDMESIFDSVDRSGVRTFCRPWPHLCTLHTLCRNALPPTVTCGQRFSRSMTVRLFGRCAPLPSACMCLPGEGVCVQASTLGSLEALLEFLRSQKEPIPVSSIAIGPIHRKDVMRAKVMLEKVGLPFEVGACALSCMLSMRCAPLAGLCLQLSEHQHALQGCKKFGIILAFDVPVTREAQELADKEGVRIMRADIIYHLFDQFTAYCKEVGCRGDELDAPCCTSMSQIFIRAEFCRSRSMSRRLQS